MIIIKLANFEDSTLNFKDNTLCVNDSKKEKGEFSKFFDMSIELVMNESPENFDNNADVFLLTYFCSPFTVNAAVVE